MLEFRRLGYKSHPINRCRDFSFVWTVSLRLCKCKECTQPTANVIEHTYYLTLYRVSRIIAYGLNNEIPWTLRRKYLFEEIHDYGISRYLKLHECRLHGAECLSIVVILRKCSLEWENFEMYQLKVCWHSSAGKTLKVEIFGGFYMYLTDTWICCGGEKCL